MRFIVGHNETVAKWVASRIPIVGDQGLEAMSAVGIEGADGKPICGVVFHDYQPRFGTLSFTIAADSPRWATRSVIKKLLSYPFLELNTNKLWTATPHLNERALKLIKGVGFTREATLARHFGKEHAIISRMFKHEFLKMYGDA